MANATTAAFITANLGLKAVPAVPEIVLYTAGPSAGLGRLLADDDDEPPYWAWPWGGGMALARYILDHPDVVRGRSIADIGCGGGLVAIASLKAGATSALAIDTEPRAIVACELNAKANGVIVTALCADPLSGEPPEADLILVGDLFYEAGLAARTSAFLDSCAARGLDILVGDPGRTSLPRKAMSLLAETNTPDFGVETGTGLVFRWK